MISLKQVNFCFVMSCLTGVVLSYYALLVELKTEENESYEAYCDINEYISCTKAFSSEYGRGFGIVAPIFGKDSILNQPNSFNGIFAYLLLALIGFSNDKSIVKVQMFFCVLSNFISVYLACILYFVLKDLCVVCCATYVVNAVNLGLCIKKWNFIKNKISSSPQAMKKEE